MLRATPQSYNTPTLSANLVNGTVHPTVLQPSNTIYQPSECYGPLRSLTTLQYCHGHHPWSYRSSTNPSILIRSQTSISLYPNQVFGSCFEPQSLNHTRTGREALTQSLPWIHLYAFYPSTKRCQPAVGSFLNSQLT